MSNALGISLRLPVNYSTVAAFGTPTLGVTITIDWPRADLTVICKPTEEGFQHVEGDNVWRYDSLFMPGQHIRLYWYPVQPGR